MTDEELILLLADTVRIACRRMTPGHLAALSGSVAQAALMPAKPDWERKAAAYATSVGMLGDATGDPVLMRVAGHAAGWTYDVAFAVGPSADGIIRNAHRRLLGYLRAGDADAAGREIEDHLRGLCFMRRLFRAAVAAPDEDLAGQENLGRASQNHMIYGIRPPTFKRQAQHVRTTAHTIEGRCRQT